MRGIACLVLVLLAAAPGFAADHANLDEGQPVRLDDAFPVDAGGWELLVGGGVAVPRHGRAQGFVPVGIQYGVTPRFQLALAGQLFAPAETTDRPKLGDVQLSGRALLHLESGWLPSISTKVGITPPTGIGSRGEAIETKLLVTKVVEPVHVHLNVAYDFFTDPRRDERSARYRLALGPSFTVPQSARTTLVGDVFATQPVTLAESVVGIEAGVRQQITPKIVIDGGVGSELAGPRDRSAIFVVLGLSIDF